MQNSFTLHCGDSAEVLKQYPDNHFDAIVTDPPYGIDFLGKEWDSHTGTVELWKEVLRVMKPGAHILAFSAPRTYHRLASNLEDVGFEIRDQIMWIFGSGFPKAQDVGRQIQKRKGVTDTKPHLYNGACIGGGDKRHQTDNEQVVCTDPEAKQWEGWKSALKPAHEPIVLARKPFKGSAVDNVLKYGTGVLNIDATRVPFEDEDDKKKQLSRPKDNTSGVKNWVATTCGDTRTEYTEITSILSEHGRYPSNVIGDIPDYQKYFYCPKVSRAERHCGFISPDQKKYGQMYGEDQQVTRENVPTTGNHHPTVKPVDLMRYLVKLITPKGGLILDPFNGSGSTGMAALAEDCNYVGIDLDQNYIDIATTRITAYRDNGFSFKPTTISKIINTYTTLFGEDKQQ